MTTHTTNYDEDGFPQDFEAVQATHVLALMTEEVKALNLSKGWYDAERTFGDDVALLHSEVSEMLEAFRDYGMAQGLYRRPDGEFDAGPRSESGAPNKPISMEFEAADVLVRLLDTCKRYEIDLFAAWRTKMDYNWTRSPRHGGKRL